MGTQTALCCRKRVATHTAYNASCRQLNEFGDSDISHTRYLTGSYGLAGIIAAWPAPLIFLSRPGLPLGEIGMDSQKSVPKPYLVICVASERSSVTNTNLAISVQHHFMVCVRLDLGAIHRANVPDCTYSEPARKKRKTAMSDRIDFLESRLKAMEAKQASGSSDHNTADLPRPSDLSAVPPRQSTDGASGARMSITHANIYHTVHKGAVEFQGISSDRTFIQSIYQQLGLWADDISQTRLPVVPVTGLFDTSSRPPVDVKLPPRDTAKRLTEAALEGQTLYSVIHRPSFEAMFNLVYSLDEADYSVHEHRFLPLLYAVLAYGCRCVSSGTETENDSDSPAGYN